MEHWGSYVNKQIREAMEQGWADNLPGQGKPLKLDNDQYTPDDLKLAHKILKENDLAPEWMLMGQDLDAQIGYLRDRLKRAYTTYQTSADDPLCAANAEAAWETARARLTETADRLNRSITSYNLRIPRGVTHKTPFNLEREIKLLSSK